MDTIKIRYECEAKVENIKDSLKTYMDWNQGSDNHDLNTLIFQKNKELASFYNDFVTQCVLDDIQDLKRLVDQSELNKKLFEAVIMNEEKAIKRAIAKGAKVNIKNEYGKTPLQVAEEEGCVDAIYALGGKITCQAV